MSDELLLQVAEPIVVRPGDTLILRYNRSPALTAADAAYIKERVEQRLPGVEVVALQADGMAVYRPEEPTS